ncbi:MAG: tRNA(fMet)-specific endonuclease VapC [Anaerolineae bacterium]|jgi:tRNA(fMet)-specific endonuclease VapC
MQMSGRYLLDTNIIIALFASETLVQQRLSEADEVFAPVIAIGELYFGAHKSARPQENLATLDEFVANVVVLGCDGVTARRYGEIKHELLAKGHPLPENDIWIAAIARQHNLTVVTRDAHFEQIEGLEIAIW